MARKRGIDLNTPRSMRLVEELEGFSTVVLNREGTRLLNRQIMFFHLAMMAAFITVIGAPFAWIAALLNILLSPKVFGWRVECTQHAVQLTELYTRSEPGIAQATSDEGTTGPKLLGLGEAPAPLDLPFSEIADIGWSDHSLWFVMHGGERHTLILELTSPEDIARLGEPIRESWAKFAAGTTVSVEEAAAERQKLAALLQHTPQG
ncbi:MAG: hypothetical protein ACI8RZ_002604 [Myxococcota bacterium]|jgi:hypothetical protein